MLKTTTPKMMALKTMIPTMTPTTTPKKMSATMLSWSTSWQRFSQLIKYWLRGVHFKPGDQVWVWTLILCCGLGEKLLKLYFRPRKGFCRLCDLNNVVLPNITRTSSLQPLQPVVFYVRLKPYLIRLGMSEWLSCCSFLFYFIVLFGMETMQF